MSQIQFQFVPRTKNAALGYELWQRCAGHKHSDTLRSSFHRCAEKVGPCYDSSGSSWTGGFVSQFCAIQILILRVSSHLILCTKCLQYSPQSGINPQVRSRICVFSGSGKSRTQFLRRNFFDSVPGYWYVLLGKLILLISLNKIIFITLCSIIPIIYHYLIIQKHYHQHRRFTKC